LIFTHWLQFLAAFLVALTILSVAVGIEEWFQRRQRRKDDPK